jgi:hypothetical protein
MKSITKKIFLASLLGFGSSSLFAQGTEAGTSVDTTATLQFTVNGQQSTATSTESYVVDDKVDMVVSTVDTQAVSVNPGATKVVLKFKVRNDGNNVHDFKLSALRTSTTAFSGANQVTDNYDLTNVKVVVDQNGNGRYDEATDTLSYIDELQPDSEKTVFIVADVPSDAANDSIAIYDLETQVEQGGTSGSEGSVISSDNRNQADDKATVQIVFADGAGVIDAEHDGKFSSNDAWRVVTATVTVKKDSIVVSDPVNGENNPKRIPGAVIRYCYIVSNATGGAEATGALVSDTINPAILDTTGQSVAMYSGSATCDCNTPDSENTASNGANGQDPDAQGRVKIDFDTVAGGATECAYVKATIK